MTRAPWVMAKPGTPWAKPGEVHDTALGWRFVNPRHDPEHTITLGETAERVAALDGITREESDAFGLRSQERAAKADRGGRLRRRDRAGRDRQGREVSPRDETARATTLEKLAALQAGLRRGRRRHRRRRRSPLSDGASRDRGRQREAVRALRPDAAGARRHQRQRRASSRT